MEDDVKKHFWEVVCDSLDKIGEQREKTLSFERRVKDDELWAQLHSKALTLLEILRHSKLPLHARSFVEATMLRNENILCFLGFVLEDEIEKMFKPELDIEAAFQPLIDFAELPTPTEVSYRWTRALHEAAQPLGDFKLADGGLCVTGSVACGSGVQTPLHKPWGNDLGPAPYRFSHLRLFAIFSRFSNVDTTLETRAFNLQTPRNNRQNLYDMYRWLLQHILDHAVQDIDHEAAQRLLKKFSPQEK